MRTTYRALNITLPAPETRIKTIQSTNPHYRLTSIPISGFLINEIRKIVDRSRAGIEEIVIDLDGKKISCIYQQRVKVSKKEQDAGEIRLMDLKISRPLYYKLRSSGFEVVTDILHAGEKYCSNIRGLGKKYKTELINTLESLGVLHRWKP